MTFGEYTMLKHPIFSLLLAAIFGIAPFSLPASAQMYSIEAGDDSDSEVYHNVEYRVTEGLPLPYTPPADATRLPLPDDDRVQNIILLIGDGMGINQVVSARYYQLGPDGRLHMERMPVTGLMSTHSHNRLITDSAASGTAIASGEKTRNGMIGMGPDTTAVVTILEAAHSSGLATGLVATSRITHATPAAFAAHQPSRHMEAYIAVDLVRSGVNVLFGGGRDYFLPQSHPESRRQDELNLMEELSENGYTVISGRDELLSLDADRAAGFFTMGSMNTRPPEPTLAEMTRKAIELLSRDNDGFFLMVEGSQIDWAGHNNDIDYSIRETLLFDDAVREALVFAERDGETLVVVTADHETGGLTIRDGRLSGRPFNAAWSSGSHTAALVPVYAYGPGSLMFSGTIDNTEIGLHFFELLSLSR